MSAFAIKRDDKGDHWTSSAWERPHRATSPERHREVAVTPLQSDLARATPRCRSRFHRSEARERPYSDVPQRHHKVALAGSDVFRATQPSRSRRNDPGATSSERHSQVAREETTRERPLAATCRGRSASICLAEFMFSQGPFGHFIMHVFTFQNLCFKYLFCSHQEGQSLFPEKN